MRYDVRIDGKTIKSFSDLDAANLWKDGYQSMHPNKIVVVVKDYGRAGE